MLNFDQATFRYDPYPIGFARNVVPEPLFSAMVESFPPTTAMLPKDNMGNKFLLTEFDGDPYVKIIKSSPPWREFYDYIKSKKFAEQMLDVLCDAKIDQGLRGVEIVNSNKLVDPVGYYSNRVIDKVRGLLPAYRGAEHLTSRFEFSALPGNGGSHYPHTDAPRKVISLVLAVMKEGEWDPSWGGGTSVCKPKDMTKNYNHLNEYIGFDDVEVLETFPFVPNGCVIFVKTFNSWHGVMPFDAGNQQAIRKSVTINIDYTGRL